MKFNTTLAAAAVLIICGFSVLRSLPRSKVSQSLETPRAQPSQTKVPNRGCESARTHASDTINRVQKLAYGDYEIETRERSATLDGYPKLVEVSYVVVRRHGKVIAKFDADIYFPLGNSAAAGLFPLLGNDSEQLIVSQDISRTGVQWVADFSKGFKIIFDGRKFLVGREANDMMIADLDSDGVQEITVPITSFYGFEKWRLTTSETPLPDIIFKYDSRRHEYLPANPQFKECLLKEINEAEQRMSSREDERLGAIMSLTLDYIFAGEEQRGWKFFQEKCKLRDKSRIRLDMQKELDGHPVYRYLQRSNLLESRRIAIRKVDFANFSYPAKPIYHKRGFRLTDGGYDGHRLPPAIAPWGPAHVSLVATASGDVTGDGNDDAIVVLTESVHGTAIPYYLYVYEMKGINPRLLLAVATGDRAEGGLKKAYAENGELVIELYGDGARVNEKLYDTNASACCPSAFTRTRYRWVKNHFVRRGQSEVISLGDTNAALEMEYQEPD